MSDDFRQLLISSVHSKTSKPVMFVYFVCVRVDEPGDTVKDLYERFCSLYDVWWDDYPCSLGLFGDSLSSVYRIVRGRVQGIKIDPNQCVVVCDLGSKGRCLLPLNCIVADYKLTPCPDDWDVRSCSIMLSFAKQNDSFVYFGSVHMDPPSGLGLAWRTVQTESAKQSVVRPLYGTIEYNVHSSTQSATHGATLSATGRQKRSRQDMPDIGYVYMMIDEQARADSSVLVKIGMTGPSQTPLDRLMSLRTGNPHLMLGMSTMVAQPKYVEARVHSAILDLADPVECQGSREFFRLYRHVSLFYLTERVLKTTFAHRLNICDLLGSKAFK